MQKTSGQRQRIVALYKAQSDGVRVGLKLRFTKDVVTEAKKYNVSWSPDAKMWFMGTQDASNFAEIARKLFSTHVYEVESLQRKIRWALANPQEYCFSSNFETTILPIKENRREMLAVFLPYDRSIIASLKKTGAFQFEPEGVYWKTYTLRISKILEILDKNGVQRDDVYVHDKWLSPKELNQWQCFKPKVKVGESAELFATEDSINKFFQNVEADIKDMRLLQIPEGLVEKATQKYGLYEFQPSGVEFLLSRSSALLADDMGLGKTRQSVVAGILTRKQGQKNLIVCPAFLRVNWQREIEKICGEPSQIIGSSENLDAPWLISSYEGTQKALDLKMDFASVIVDEAHFINNMHSARTRRLLTLGEKASKVMLLTGTPILNKPEELYTLLLISGHPLAKKTSLEGFRKLFSVRKYAHKKLNILLSDWMLRRTKDKVMNLGEKKESFIYMELDSQTQKKYDELYNNTQMPALSKLIYLRMLLEEYKLNFATDSAMGLNKGDKSLIFCFFKRSVAIAENAFLENKFKSVRITGDESPKKKVAAEDKLQNDALIRNCTATLDAAYAGLNLTAANYVFFPTLPWTPAKKKQAEDRAYRNGQTKDVHIITPVVINTIDEQILKVLEYKKAVSDDITEDDDEVQEIVLQKIFGESKKENGQPKIRLKKGA